jgi:regulator of CtrA degradation
MGKLFTLSSEGCVTISFGEHFQASEQFDAVFKEGMGLVERTAAYLDGDGRTEAKALKPPVSMLYATESMRLTTRLLEMASWLLIRRALKEGEITAEEAERKRQRLKLKSLSRPSHVRSFDELPESLRALIEKSFSLQDRIVQLDRAIAVGSEPAETAETPLANPVIAQMSLLQSAFRR